MDDPSRRPNFGREPSQLTTRTISTTPSGQSLASTSTARRQVTPLACNECRRVKCKCDGERPTCGFCERKGLVCDYDAGYRGRTALMAQRHKNDQLQDQNTQLQEQNNQLRELLRLVAIMPPSESSEILRLLRANEDPINVLQMIQHARIMLPRDNETAETLSTVITSAHTTDKSTMNSPTDSVSPNVARPDNAQTQHQQGPIVRRGPVQLISLLNPPTHDD